MDGASDEAPIRHDMLVSTASSPRFPDSAVDDYLRVAWEAERSQAGRRAEHRPRIGLVRAGCEQQGQQ